jgi:hypothetical protein
MLKIETAEQALDLVARTLPFARDLRERSEQGTIKQMLIAAGVVPEDISHEDWKANFGQTLKPMIGFLLNAMAKAEEIAGGDPLTLLANIVHANGQHTRTFDRLLEAAARRQLQQEASERAKAIQAARTPHERSLSAIKANETRGPEGRRAAARKAVATRKGIPFEG